MRNALRTAVWVLLPAALAAADATVTNEQLLQRVEELERRLAMLEGKAPKSAVPVAAVAPAPTPPEPVVASGTTVNFLLDGYYSYNSNSPASRVNELRVFDRSASSFTVSQAAMLVERAPDPAAGRRFGARLDLLFGPATETLSGSPANELRPSVYRHFLQAYGTYVAPLGKGLTMDFGHFLSPVGMEGVITKDQINYSRSLLCYALPYTHTGLRTSYAVSSKVTATWLLVNGLNQSDDFNAFKSNYFLVSTTPAKNFSWSGGYWVGRESRVPGERGRTHIADSYMNWGVTPKLTAALEGTLLVSRNEAGGPPMRMTGTAGYLKYQFVPRFSLASRMEYVSDRGGYLSGASQALKEVTLTAAYQPAEGFQVRWEVRRDFANQAFFDGRRQQTTALMGLLWWFGPKQGAW